MLSERFKIQKRLGQGGNATVELVEDTQSGELLACKIIKNGSSG